MGWNSKDKEVFVGIYIEYMLKIAFYKLFDFTDHQIYFERFHYLPL